MTLGGALLLVLGAAVGGGSGGGAGPDQLLADAGRATVVAHAAVGFLLWLVGTVLLMLSFLDRGFPAAAAAAARLAHAALQRLL